MIEATDLLKSYRIDGQVLKAVDNASLNVERGEMVSIIGHSGSGKTTLLSLIGGLTKPDSGHVRIDNIDIWSMNDKSRSEFRNKKLSFIYQFSSLIPTLTSLENIMLPTAFGNYNRETENLARGLLKDIGLEDKTNSLPSHLSGGQQRRIAIARAFINNPEIVLADEPTGDLDEETEKDILGLFQRMNIEKKVTFLIVTHNKDIAAKAMKQIRMTQGILTPV